MVERKKADSQMLLDVDIFKLKVSVNYYSEPDQSETLSFNTSPETFVSTQPERGTFSAMMFTYTLARIW